MKNEEANRRELERAYCQGLQLELGKQGLDELERQKLKKEYCGGLPQIEQIRVRPHHLLCLLCAYGDEEAMPSPDNNVFEIMQRIEEDPEVKLEIVEGTDDNCLCCPNRVGSLCVSGSVVRDLKKDQDVLERTGLRVGDVRPAKAVYDLVMERIPTIKGMCTYENQDPPVWRDCSTSSKGFYENAIRKGLWF